MNKKIENYDYVFGSGITQKENKKKSIFSNFKTLIIAEILKKKEVHWFWG